MNSATGELLNGGTRVRVPGQPFKMLVVLLSRPGELVTRDQLRDEIWSDKTFVDFDHGLHAGMNKLRRALNDSADAPKYIETVPTRGYRFIGKLADSDEPLPDVAIPDVPVTAPASLDWRRIAVKWVPLVIVLIGAVLFWTFKSRTAHQPIWKLSRITFPSVGFSQTPALSSDGRLVAYSSDSNPERYQDLYVKQIAGGQPLRLTFDGSNNVSPDFSPDGSKIVFRSGRDGGGIYETPTLGGPVRFIARDGWDPKYSPDGLEVAYWTGAPSIGQSIPGNGEVWIISLNGGPPRRVGAQLTTARHPIWSPDGKKLLVAGYRSTRSLESARLDWWIVSTDGKNAIMTGAYQLLMRAGLGHAEKVVTPVPGSPRPGCWSMVGNKVTFSRIGGDERNIWQLAISPETGRVEGGLERVTTGSGNEVDPSCAGGSFVFANIDTSANIWSFSLDSNGGAGAVLQRIGRDAAEQRNPFFSKDGRFLAFLSTRSGSGNVLRRELATGREQIVAPSFLVQGFPVLNSSGDRTAYAVYEEKDRRAVYVSTSEKAPRKVCEGCLRATDWSSDDKGLLVFVEDPYQIDYLDVGTLYRTPLLKHPSYGLLYGKFSPDNRWISFTARTQSNHARIFIAPFPGLQLIAESTWIQIADVDPDDYALWSPDGKTMYYTSTRDGFTCLWGQRLDPSHHPEGEPFPVRHFHGSVRFIHKGWSVSATRIAIALAERTGSIWMMSRAVHENAAAVR